MSIRDSSVLKFGEGLGNKGGMTEMKSDEDLPSIDISCISSLLHTARNEQENIKGRRLSREENYLWKQGDVVGVKIHVAVAVNKAEDTGNKTKLI